MKPRRKPAPETRANTRKTPPAPAHCEFCGLSYADFLSAGRLGCPQCYASFRPKLENLFATRQGCSSYTEACAAPAPKGAKKLPFRSEALEQALAKAVAREDFERAALLRDMLRQPGQR